MYEFYKNLGVKIKKIREKISLSQEAVAMELGISRVSISQIETGNRKISTEELFKLAKIFNISTDVLLCQELKLLKYIKQKDLLAKP